MIYLAVFAPILLALLTWATWDVLVLFGVIHQPLISVEMWTLSQEYPIIPSIICLTVGVLIGHFEWQMPNDICAK